MNVGQEKPRYIIEDNDRNNSKQILDGGSELNKIDLSFKNENNGENCFENNMESKLLFSEKAKKNLEETLKECDKEYWFYQSSSGPSCIETSPSNIIEYLKNIGEWDENDDIISGARKLKSWYEFHGNFDRFIELLTPYAKVK